jgi:20S proteasome alpha/beta subunit
MRRKILVTNSPQLEHGISVIRAHLREVMKEDVSTAEAIRVAVAVMAEAIEANKKESDSE